MQYTQYMITKEILSADFKGSSKGLLRTTYTFIYIYTIYIYGNPHYVLLTNNDKF